MLTPVCWRTQCSPSSTADRRDPGRPWPTRCCRPCSRVRARRCSTSPTRSRVEAPMAPGTHWPSPTRSSAASTGRRRTHRAPPPSWPTSPPSRLQLPALGRIVGHHAVRRDAQAGKGRQTRRRTGPGRAADPDRRHDRRPGDALRRCAGDGRPHRRFPTPHLRQHRAHRVRRAATCIDDPVDPYFVAGTMPAVGTRCAPD